MTEPSGGGMDDRNEREGTPPPLTKEQIEGHISAIKSIIKDYNRQNKADPIRLDFGTDNILLKEGRVARGKDVGEEDLSKPFKEILKTPLTRRIIEFAGPEYENGPCQFGVGCFSKHWTEEPGAGSRVFHSIASMNGTN
ncbi:hypothetical protein Tco_0994703 [Tanacetum coccineum]